MLDHNKIIHVGKDSPSVNLKFFRCWKEQLANEGKYFGAINEI